MAVTKMVKVQAVVSALEPEPAWKHLRTYATLGIAGVILAPVSRVVLLTSVSSSTTTSGSDPGSLLIQGKCRWWFPLVWWRGMCMGFFNLRHRAHLWRFSRFTFFQVLHDVATRGRMQWVEVATDIGAQRPVRSVWRTMAIEVLCGALGNRMMLEYVRSAVGGEWPQPCSWRYFALGCAAGAARGAVVATGGHNRNVQRVCGWAEFLLELASEREAACLLGHKCPLLQYFATVGCGIISLLPWGLLVFPGNWFVQRAFGEDPIVEQRAVLEHVAKELEVSQRGHEALQNARTRAGNFVATVELCSLWRRVKVTRDICDFVRTSSFREQAPAQQTLGIIRAKVGQLHLPKLQNRIAPNGNLTFNGALAVLTSSMVPIVVKRQGDLVRSVLAQVAERSLDDLLMGITAQQLPGLQEVSVVGMLGFFVKFTGEEGVDDGGVRRELLDSFAEAITSNLQDPSKLALVEPLHLLGLGPDTTWRPVPCDDESRGFLWALGRLLALAFLHRCPCAVPFSLLVFKCILGTPLRPGDVSRLDPDFWRHRIQPLLYDDGATKRQEELKSWGMDPMTFTSVDGSRELCAGGANTLVTEENKDEYAQLLCEDFLIGEVRAEYGCLVTGFREVVPQSYLKELDAEQLRMLVCGVAELCVDDWQNNAKVEGSVEVACWFFDWLRMQSQEVRSKMLAFSTGSSRLPGGWDGLKDQVGRPLPFRVSATGDPQALPTAHTCANLLVLPQVTKRRHLEKKLEKVVDLCGREMMFA